MKLNMLNDEQIAFLSRLGFKINNYSSYDIDVLEPIVDELMNIESGGTETPDESMAEAILTAITTHSNW